MNSARQVGGQQIKAIVQTKAPDAFPFLDLKTVPEVQRRNIRVSYGSIYGDRSWTFHEELGAHSIHDYLIDFHRVRLADGSTLTDTANELLCGEVKELVYSFIANPPPTRPKLTTVINCIGRGVFSLVRFMHANHIRDFSEMTEDDFDRFLVEMENIPNGNDRTKAPGADTLVTRTRGIAWIYDQRRKVSHGLRFNPWGRQSPKDWAEAATGTKAEQGRTPEMPDDVARTVIQAAIVEMRNYPRYFEAGKAYKEFRKSGQKLGFDWTQFGFRSHFEWNSIPAYVSAAGYILIAMFSGMRVHEITGIRLTYEDPTTGESVPCTSVEDIEVNSEVRRCFFIRSYTTKLEKEPLLTKWQVAPIAHEAVEAVIAMRSRYRSASNILFVSRNRGAKTDRYSGQSVNDLLKTFARRHAITWNGKIWDFTTHQFRKKFARLLVRQGLGMRDIQDQMKHIDIEMTKRYGDMDLHFELQQERFPLSREQYEELLRGSTPIIGGGADELETMRTEFLGKTREDQDKMLDELTKASLIDAVDFGLCLYNAKRSKCGGRAKNCQPADCLNCVIPVDTAMRHLRGRHARNEHLLKRVKSPLARAHLLEMQKVTCRLLDQAASKNIPTPDELKALA